MCRFPRRHQDRSEAKRHRPLEARTHRTAAFNADVSAFWNLISERGIYSRSSSQRVAKMCCRLSVGWSRETAGLLPGFLRSATRLQIGPDQPIASGFNRDCDAVFFRPRNVILPTTKIVRDILFFQIVHLSGTGNSDLTKRGHSLEIPTPISHAFDKRHKARALKRRKFRYVHFSHEMWELIRSRDVKWTFRTIPPLPRENVRS